MAHVAEWRVRETTTTEGTVDLVLAGPMQGSLPFQDAVVMAVGDTCDYVVHYDTVFEAGRGTMAADGKLQRTTVYRAQHANGDRNTTKVSLPPGVKTVIMDYRAAKIPRVDIAQSFSAGETAQHRVDVPPFKSGTRLVFQQTAAPVGWTKDVSSPDYARR